jgi:hypothetical protein
MKHVLIMLASACALSVFSGTAAAQNPIQLSLFPPIQIVPENEPVSALRLSVYGANTDMTGFDFGIASKTTGTFKGVQWTLVGLVDQDFTGWQSNLVSITGGSMTGLQMGAYNSANFCNGLQFGIFNSSQSMKGIQLGLINMIKTGGWMPIFPIVNWGGL